MLDTTPFSFEDPDRVRAVLQSASFRNVRVEAFDQLVSSGGVDEMAAVLLRVGPLGKILRENRSSAVKQSLSSAPPSIQKVQAQTYR